MAFDPVDWVRPHIRQMPVYEPILPAEVLSAELGISAAQLVKLDANENPYGAFPEARVALAQLHNAHIYPDPKIRCLRADLAEWHGVPIENLFVGAGSDELIDLLVRILLDPGQSLVDCPPTFGMYAFDAALNAAQVLDAPRRSDFHMNLELIEKIVRQRHPKLLFVASPNNPDGLLLPDEDLERMLALPMLVVLDEAYVEFAPPGASQIGKVIHHDNLVVLRTFSKWAGLAGLRVGYGAFPTWLMPYLWRAKQPYNVSVAATAAARASIHSQAWLVDVRKKIIDERERLNKNLRKIPWLKPFPSNANFILCRIIDRSAWSVKKTLAQSGVLVRYFNKPGLEDCIRISIGRPDQMDFLVRLLQEME